MLTFRQITREDTPELSTLLIGTVGNSDALHAGLLKECSGWVACLNGTPVGLGLANRGMGEVQVIAILPSSSGQGLGRELLKQAEAWLFSHGWGEIWLSLPGSGCNRAADYFRHLGWVDWKKDVDRLYLKKANPRTTFALEEHVVEDAATGYVRLVRLQRGPPGQPHRLCLFLDGEHYWRDMDAVPVLNALLESGRLPPMSFAFVGHVSGAARHEDYTCNERYAHFIGDAVMPWLKGEISDLQEGGHLVCGLSLSGLMAVYQTLRYPQHFSACLSQSGSHWWNHVWFAEMAGQRAPINARFWMSVGDRETQVNVKHPPAGLLQEISQIAGVEKAAEILAGIGGTVHYHQFQGGHSMQCWRDELGDALCWLASGEEKSGS